MILLDFSQIAISAILAFQRDLSVGCDPDSSRNLIRHVVLNSIKSYKKTYSKKYGELVLAMDSRHYWRKDIFPFYKGDRKKKRKDSTLDWTLIFETLNSIKEDLRTVFPYKVVEVHGAEADDVIAILTKTYCRNEKVLIVSTDEDYFQLHENDNVQQFSPKTKKLIKLTKAEIIAKKITHIVKAGDDGIPNILSADNSIVEGIRQKPIKAELVEAFIKNGIDACRNDEERTNYQRNQRLVDFNFIPPEITKAINEEYKNYKVVGSKMKVYNYLIEHRCKVLLNEIDEF